VAFERINQEERIGIYGEIWFCSISLGNVFCWLGLDDL
jgi:hypothetical protein